MNVTKNNIFFFVKSITKVVLLPLAGSYLLLNKSVDKHLSLCFKFAKSSTTTSERSNHESGVVVACEMINLAAAIHCLESEGCST